MLGLLDPCQNRVVIAGPYSRAEVSIHVDSLRLRILRQICPHEGVVECL